MNNIIKLLDNKTINKIAAGEVIERPASVIKELVENSIDAMSSYITVEIVDGGKKYIRVTDNGIGISTNNIDLAFLRHSTSKITNVDDLQSLVTLGFRGEALASIAAISQLELITRTEESISGVRVLINGGQIIEKSEVGCPIGTTIILKNLFFNVPVRQKFLKSDTVESSYISDIVYKLSLGNPGIKFKYIKDSKMIVNTPGKSDSKTTAYSLLGKDFANSMFDVSYNGNDMKIYGLTCNPSFTRGNRNHQYTYVNGRFIKSEEITEIIENVYKTLIPINRFPVYILYIEINPELIDVNVHPTKTEIRFSNRDQIKNSVTIAINDTLSRNNLIHEVIVTSNKNKEEKEIQLQESFLDYNTRQNHKDDYSVEELSLDELNRIGVIEKIKTLPQDKHDQNVYSNDIIRVLDLSINEPDDKQYERKSISKVESMPDLSIIGVLFDTYILAEDRLEKQFYLIDQHAAHERIMYEKIKYQLESEEVYMQQLITPQIISFSHSEMQLIKEDMYLFKQLGFDLEEFGFNSIALRSVPLVFGTPDTKNLFLDIFDKLKSEVKSNYDVRLEKVMKMACTSAIKAGYNIKDIEIDTLLNELKNTKQPYTCPHGRPVIIKISKYELEKRFKRV